MSTALFAGTVQTHVGGYNPAPPAGEALVGALRACLDEAQLLDRHGFDGILVAERHGRSECVAPDPIGLLSALAGVTDHAFLGTYVHLGLLHHPVDVAERFAQLDAVSGGRAVAGLGAGYHPDYFALYGTDPAARLARLKQLVGLLRTAWSGGELDTEWEGRRLVGSIHPRPIAGTIPIWLGAQFPQSVALAGRIADGWAVAFPFDRATWDRHRESYVAGCTAVGRAPTIALSRHCWVSDSPEKAAELYVPYWLAEQRYYFDRGQLQHSDFRSTGDFTVGNAVPNLVLGTPQQCAEQLVHLVRDWGVDVVKLASRLPLGPAPEAVLDNWRQIGEEVLPLVRKELTGSSERSPSPRRVLEPVRDRPGDLEGDRPARP